MLRCLLTTKKYISKLFATAKGEFFMEECLHGWRIVDLGGSSMEVYEQGSLWRCGGLGGAC